LIDLEAMDGPAPQNMYESFPGTVGLSLSQSEPILLCISDDSSLVEICDLDMETFKSFE
jgi:hypothetical protein